MLRNKEFFYYIVAAAGATVAAVVFCFILQPTAGVVCFAGCAGVSAISAVFTWRRYRRIAALSVYLRKIIHGETALDIRDNAEGELSILKNEIYKAARALTEQAAVLREDKRALAAALSDISHQLKTPLTSLGIMADLLEKDSLPPEKRSEFMNAMRSSLNRMDWLVRTLLKLARLDAGAALLKKTPVRLSALIEKACVPMLIPMEIKNQALDMSGEDAEMICDPDWTAEALGNIFKNAVENTPEGGHITVISGANPLYAYIQIKDSGPGIDRADLPHIFKRFYRGKNAGHDSIGIGLAMSLAVMREQNGDIEVHNDDGSVFTIKFYMTNLSPNVSR